MSQKEHLVNISTTTRTITVIETRRKNRPEGLRKPYEYVLSMKEVEALCDELRAGLKDAESKGFQCSLVSRKGLTKGIWLSFFLLGYRPGFGTAGVSPTLWGETVRVVQRLLTKYLGKDARVYAEPYSNDKKFQARFETYIMFGEFCEN